MTLDPQAAALRDALLARAAPPLEQMSVPQARQAVMAYTQMQGEPEAVAEVRDLLVPGPAGALPVRVYLPAGERPAPLVVYFHGGGWVIGDIELVDRPCRALANASGAVVASVEYRRSPETKYPGPPEDASAATRWLSEHAGELSADPGRVVVAGDSAGGNLAAVTALMARDRGGPAIALQVLIYPVTAPAAGSAFASYDENAEGYQLTRAAMEWFWYHYVPTPEDARAPYASPLLADDLRNLLPAVVIVAGYDPLRDEGIAYAQRLTECGVKARLRRFDGQMHGFFWFTGMLDAASEAAGEIGAAVRALEGKRT